MKLLRIRAAGLPLFKGTAEVNFTAEQRITKDSKEEMYNIFSNTYQNNVISVSGVNSSGKTTLLKVLAFSINLLENKPVNAIPYNDILEGISGEQKAEFEICFYCREQIYCLKTVIKKQGKHYYIAEEVLMSKKAAKIMNKTSVFDFTAKASVFKRNTNEEFLSDDVSIIIAFNKKTGEHIHFTDMLSERSFNVLNFLGYIPGELLERELLNKNIDYLKACDMNGKSEIRLKFKNRAEIILNRYEDINRYISLGTIKGINMFIEAEKVFESGGYIIIDEFENHLNRTVIYKLINYFQSKRKNPGGAVLVFSTHCPELLDRFERNDNIYIVKNNNGITVKNLTGILKRNDIKKSEVFYDYCAEDETVPLILPNYFR